MKAMKSLSVNNLLGAKRSRSKNGTRSSHEAGSNSAALPPNNDDDDDEFPEFMFDEEKLADVTERQAVIYCEFTGRADTGDKDITNLPYIVETAARSAPAARRVAEVIRKYLKRRYWEKRNLQKQALGLLRCMIQRQEMQLMQELGTPQYTNMFTKELGHGALVKQKKKMFGKESDVEESKFTCTVRTLFSDGKQDVKQELMWILQFCQKERHGDPGLAPLIAMWEAAHDSARQTLTGSRNMQDVQSRPTQPAQNSDFWKPHQPNYTLPSDEELHSRITEAQISASMLKDCTDRLCQEVVLPDAWANETRDKCSAASTDLVQYLVRTDPGPSEHVRTALGVTVKNLLEVLELFQNTKEHIEKVLADREAQLTSEVQQIPPRPAMVGNTRSSDGRSGWLATASDNGDSSDRTLSHDKGKGKGKAVLPYTVSDVPPPPGPPPQSGRAPTKAPYTSAAADAAAASSSSSRRPYEPYEASDDPFQDPQHPEPISASFRTGSSSGGGGEGGERGGGGGGGAVASGAGHGGLKISPASAAAAATAHAHEPYSPGHVSAAGSPDSRQQLQHSGPAAAAAAAAGGGGNRQVSNTASPQRAPPPIPAKSNAGSNDIAESPALVGDDHGGGVQGQHTREGRFSGGNWQVENGDTDGEDRVRGKQTMYRY